MNIVMDAVEGLTIREYALAIGGLIGPANMVSISRISGGRICVYLNSIETTEILINRYKNVNINSHTIDIRPLNAKSKRILISNVHTSIPNTELEKIFAQFGIVPKSQITKLKTGLHDVGYTHLLSHRRQVYIDPSDEEKLPNSFQLKHEDVTYWIYFSTEKLICYLCKEEGHPARHCRSTNADNQDDSASAPEMGTNIQESAEQSTFDRKMLLPSRIGESSTALTKNNIEDGKRSDSSHFAQPNNTLKRQASKSISIASTHSGEIAVHDTPALEKSKGTKLRRTEVFPEAVAQQLEPAKSLITTKQYPLSFEKMTEFLVAAYDNHHIYEEACKFTPDMQALNLMLTDIVEEITDKNLIHRIKRIQKRITTTKIPDPLDQDAYASDCSVVTSGSLHE
ncbi:hypothetical protein QAD02_017185 [Eretmocerus hayati]|uniref:Uncharacterized protein n=1 Tax=Eretmocerus hayati TaxID=131215 RepID=A0ACC2PD63_9HYME|nr:hypothetical protein QAD02_017185 [Eretmocerus hayati]